MDRHLNAYCAALMSPSGNNSQTTEALCFSTSLFLGAFPNQPVLCNLIALMIALFFTTAQLFRGGVFPLICVVEELLRSVICE